MGERPSRVATVASQLRQIEPRATLSAERKPDLSFFPATQGFDHDFEPSRWPQPVR